MEKPISLIIEEAKVEISNSIQNQNLHPSILLPIIKDIYMEVERAAKIQYQNEKQQYEESLIDKTNKETIIEESTEE